MIVDTSAVVAWVRAEADAAHIEDILVGEAPHRMSAATRVELGLVLGGALAEEAIDRILQTFDIEVVPFTREQARLASEAHRRFGRGNHPAGLDLGDVYSYALAAETGDALVCIGNDFAKTDIRVAP